MNRLADYLYVLARYEEAEAAGQKNGASEYVEIDGKHLLKIRNYMQVELRKWQEEA